MIDQKVDNEELPVAEIEEDFSDIHWDDILPEDIRKPLHLKAVL